VSIVVYAGAAGLVLPPTPGDRKQEIVGALERLSAGGSTNGGAGIELAYRVAIESFQDGGVNRVILCSDGDFNVGVRDRGQLQELITQKARSNVFLTVLGFGGSNYNDALSETLADKGNGNYALIDTAREAKKVLVEQSAGTLVTIAKDVKIQVEWNSKVVASYRLLGYENRVMANADFRDDKKDAGEVGAGHTVTALYEVVPVDAPADDAMVTVRLRYKQPEGDTAKELEFPATDAGGSFDSASEDTRFAASVAAFGMLLRGSRHAGQASWALVDELARGAVGKDRGGYRAEMLQLIARARELSGGR
jgi:Ca-activated chloride channel family protein